MKFSFVFLWFFLFSHTFLITKQKKIEIVKFMIILLYKTSKEITIIYVKVIRERE